MAAETTPLRESDEAFQYRLLDGVSRTFALTIPALPPALRGVVGNAYLLCRIVDTIEDDPGLDADAKERTARAFVDVVRGGGDPSAFAAEVTARLTTATIPQERELVGRVEEVVRITHRFAPAQRAELERCVGLMARGMIHFQRRGADAHRGLADLMAMNHYCYHVAGVVGEMLTGLFVLEIPELERRRGELMALARSFGQGLQMTNILKDIQEDLARGACWLPRSVFLEAGFDIDDLAPGTTDPGFARGVVHLTGVARTHLENALAYTLCIPARESGVRMFCLWALGMAVLTLRKVRANPAFTRGREVTISRASVRRTVAVSRAAVRHDRVLRLLFQAAARGLPRLPVDLAQLGPPPDLPPE